MKRFDDVIEVGHLPTPKLIEEISFDLLRDRQLAEYQRLWPDFSDQTEFEPVRAHLGVDAYSENLIRQRINEAANASHLALATGADLDIKGEARMVKRKILSAGDPNAYPPVPPEYEPDEEYMRRIQLAPESWSVAGPEGAYVFWAMVPETSFDVTAVSPEPCEALITVMGRTDGGTATQAELDAVDAALDERKIVPFTDRKTIRTVDVIERVWTGTLFVKPGADANVVLIAAQERAAAYVSSLRYIGRSARSVGAYGALAVPGVERAEHNLADGHTIQDNEVLHFTDVNFDVEVAA